MNDERLALICAVVTGLLARNRIGTTHKEMAEEACEIADAVMAREQQKISKGEQR